MTYWHLRRALRTIGNLINNQALIRSKMNVRKYYKQGLSKAKLDDSGNNLSITISNTNKIAKIWEFGYKSYNYSRRVLSNLNLKRIMQGLKGRYIRLKIKGQWRTISEATMNKKPWIMPPLEPTHAYQRAFKAVKPQIQAKAREALRLDIIGAIKRG